MGPTTARRGVMRFTDDTHYKCKNLHRLYDGGHVWFLRNPHDARRLMTFTDD